MQWKGKRILKTKLHSKRSDNVGQRRQQNDRASVNNMACKWKAETTMTVADWMRKEKNMRSAVLEQNYAMWD